MMKLVCHFLFVLVLLSNADAQEFFSDHFDLKKLGDGIYAAINKPGGYAICNSGIVDLGDEALVFDCFISPGAAEDLKRAAEEITGNKVKYVVNSHFHNDHIRGNQVFVDAEIISTQITKELIEQYEPEELEWEKSIVDQRIDTMLKRISMETDSLMLEENKMWLGYYKAIKESFSVYKTTLPNVFLKDTLIIRGSRREAILFTKGKGHTESDIVMWLPDEQILFAGDLLFVDCHPWLGDGFPEDWAAYLNALKNLNAKLIVPGHGSVCKSNQLDVLIKYLRDTESLAENAFIDSLTEDELKSTAIPEEYKNWWFGRFFVPNVLFQYNLIVEKREQ